MNIKYPFGAAVLALSVSACGAPASQCSIESNDNPGMRRVGQFFKNPGGEDELKLKVTTAGGSDLDRTPYVKDVYTGRRVNMDEAGVREILQAYCTGESETGIILEAMKVAPPVLKTL